MATLLCHNSTLCREAKSVTKHAWLSQHVKMLVTCHDKLKAWSTVMAQPVEMTTILKAQPFWMLLEMNTLCSFSSRRAPADKQTDRQTDATKRIISPDLRSIIMTITKPTGKIKDNTVLLRWPFHTTVLNQSMCFTMTCHGNIMDYHGGLVTKHLRKADLTRQTPQRSVCFHCRNYCLCHI